MKMIFLNDYCKGGTWVSSEHLRRDRPTQNKRSLLAKEIPSGKKFFNEEVHRGKGLCWGCKGRQRSQGWGILAHSPIGHMQKWEKPHNY